MNKYVTAILVICAVMLTCCAVDATLAFCHWVDVVTAPVK